MSDAIHFPEAGTVCFEEAKKIRPAKVEEVKQDDLETYLFLR